MADENSIQIAILQTQVASLTSEITDLKTSVKELTAIMNRGKGAFAASLALAGIVGGSIVEGISWLFHSGNGGHS